MHPDFEDIYEYAYDAGLILKVFTNGSNITDSILKLFTEKPPTRVYLTLYGDSFETYEKVTGNGMYCAICKDAVRQLAEKKIDVIVQGTFGVDNYNDMEAIYDYVSQYGLMYKYTTNLVACGNCTQEIAEEYLAHEARIKELSSNIWHKINKKTREETAKVKRSVFPIFDNTNVGIKCQAGRCSCFIRHDGKMLACNTFDAYAVDTHDKSVVDCFAELNKWACGLKRIMECEGCPHAIHCTTCVAAHYNDTHQLGVPSPRLCYKIREPEKAAAERAFYEEHGYIEI